MRNDPQSSPVRSDAPVLQHWRAEAVRLREAHWGPLEDQAAIQAALRSSDTLQQRILQRAAWLAAHGSLQRSLDQWVQAARWAWLAVWLLSGLAGIGAATAALNPAHGSINLAMAVLGLLGLHACTFLIWLISCLPSLQPSNTLSRLWLWLTRKIVRGPDTALAAQAFLSLLARARAWKPATGVLSHGAWSIAYLCAVPTLIVLLSTRSYTFHWETTLLSPDAFLAFSRWLGSLPHLLGFPLPDNLAVAQSMDHTPAPATIQADWSLWLIGCIVGWGLLPRLLGLAVCGLWLRHRLQRLSIDTALPGWLELRERLQPTHDTLGVDRPAGRTDVNQRTHAAQNPSTTQQSAVLAYELGTDLPWPPDGLPDTIDDLGRSDSREDRARIRRQLGARHILLVCDARLTPDRGALVWFDELRHACDDLHILCLEGSPERRRVWRQILSRHHLRQTPSLADWLEHLEHPRHD